jgi:hypothetical protein
MKQKPKKIISLVDELKVILTILLIVFGLFYWYEIKPSKIEAECSSFALKSINIDGNFEYFDVLYGICMRNGGVENTREVVQNSFEELKEDIKKK